MKNHNDSNYDPDLENNILKNWTRSIDCHLNMPFYITKLVDAMSNYCKSKSPGLDHTPHSFIENLPNNEHTRLLQIYLYNIIWENGIYQINVNPESKTRIKMQ